MDLCRMQENISWLTRGKSKNMSAADGRSFALRANFRKLPDDCRINQWFHRSAAVRRLFPRHSPLSDRPASSAVSEGHALRHIRNAANIGEGARSRLARVVQNQKKTVRRAPLNPPRRFYSGSSPKRTRASRAACCSASLLVLPSPRPMTLEFRRASTEKRLS